MTCFLSLFSGIGGFDLGAYWAGLRFDRHFFSEVDAHAIRIFSNRFPDAEPLGDIRGIRAENLPRGDWILAGGFPCQDISVAGKGAGLDGERSGLWYEYARLIGELRPRYAIMENVGALAVRGLDRVLGSLTALGYDAEWQDIRASDVGAPHKRERIWIVGYPSGSGCGGLARGRTGKESADGHLQLETGAMADSESRGLKGRDVPKGPRAKREGATNLSGSRETLAHAESGRRGEGDSINRGSPEGAREAGEWCGPPDSDSICRRSTAGGWLPESGIRRVAHGIPDRVHRLKGLGNSIVPQISELIFKEIAKCEGAL